jgi:uncharacterized protein YutE (UPF0331/DUF86 family)
MSEVVFITPENPTNGSQNQHTNYGRCVLNLSHYLYHLSFRIYPLPKDEFKNQSILRRAAYDYIIEIYEAAYKISKWLIEALDERLVENNSYQCFKQAEQTGIFPKDLVKALIDLKRLRNNLAHEDDQVNKYLIAYSRIGKVMITGYATLEIAQAIKLWRREPKSGLLAIDRSYLERIAASWPITAATLSQICTKLAKDGTLISIEINFDNVKTLIQRYPKLLRFSIY